MPVYNPSIVQISSSVTASSVSSSSSSVTLLAANANRKGATIFNNSASNLYIEFGATATNVTTGTSNGYAEKLIPGAFFEVPFGYTGAIAGIWDLASGAAFVREFV